MKVRYDRNEDILLMETSEDKIDYAEEAGSVIVHYSKERKPVLLEIQDASEFLSQMQQLKTNSQAGLSVEVEI
ncbi:MAG: DUF2283 domain-containing protein [Ignavibacteriae bacterium]|nr:DUF2283 domain-containing protein [Ignavibacteriota bacterium]